LKKEAPRLALSGVRKNEIVIIAGGKIGPIEDWIEKVLKNGTNDNIRLFYGANSRKDLNGYRNVKYMAELSDSFDMVTALNSSDPNWQGEVGLITDVVRERLDPEKVSQCFLYGTTVMIEETKRTLTDIGISEEKIHHESYGRTY